MGDSIFGNRDSGHLVDARAEFYFAWRDRDSCLVCHRRDYQSALEDFASHPFRLLLRDDPRSPRLDDWHNRLGCRPARLLVAPFLGRHIWFEAAVGGCLGIAGGIVTAWW